MGVELTMLTYAVALLIVLVAIQAASGVQAQGLVPMANNRDNLPAPKVWQARTLRVVDNHREGITMFAPLVLIAAVIDNGFTSWTALGAQLFFWARLAHAIIYLAGFPMIRPLTWAISMAGIVLVLLSLLGILS